MSESENAWTYLCQIWWRNKKTGNPANTKHLYNICTTWPNAFDVGSAFYKCYTNVLCLLGNTCDCTCAWNSLVIEHVFITVFILQYYYTSIKISLFFPFSLTIIQIHCIYYYSYVVVIPTPRWINKSMCRYSDRIHDTDSFIWSNKNIYTF